VKVNLPATLFMPASAQAPIQLVAPAVTAETAVSADEVHAQSGLSHAFVALCVSTVALQALDVRSTYAVIARGGAEGNPVLVSVVPNKAAFIAFKAGIAATTILAASKIAKHHKVAAVVTLIALNSVYATVVAHNFSLANQLR
jgi:hypothetical protein